MLYSRSLFVIYLIYSSVCVNPKLIIDPSPSTMFLSVFGNCGLAEIFLYIKSCTYSPNHMIIHQTLRLFWQRLLLLFSCSVLSNSLQPLGLQHARFPCPSPSPGACSNSCPLSQWCHPTTSSSVVSFSSCLQSLPASGSFPLSRLFTSGGQITGASASTSVFPMNIQDWFPLGLTYLISLAKVTPSKPQTNS